MSEGVTVQRIRGHLVIKIPLEETEEKKTIDEDEVLLLADEGL